MNHKQQDGSGKRPFIANLLPRFRPFAQSLSEVRHYSRAKSKSIGELFPNSGPSIEYFIQYKEKLALSIAHTVAQDLLNAPDFAPGDYKLILRPVDGGKTVFLYESLRHNDIIGLKLIKGECNGEEVRVAEIRYKKKTSVAQKGLELELGAPRMKSIMSADTYADALAELGKAMADPEVSPRKKEKLAPMLSALEAERQGQEYMFIEACGNESARVAKAKAMLSRLAGEIDALEKAGRLIAKPDDGDEKKMAVKNHVGALEAWPFPPEQELAKSFFKVLSPGSKAYLSYISKECLAGALPNAKGVAILEHTALDSISQLQSLLRLLHSQTMPSADEPVCGAIAEFDFKFARLHEMIGGAAREQAELSAQDASYASEQWFLKLCSAMNSRKKLLRALSELEETAGRLANEPCRHQAKKIISNMAFNLCRVHPGEISLLESFIHHEDVKKDMKRLQAKEYRKNPLQQIPALLESFMKASGEEAKKAAECVRKEEEYAKKQAIENRASHEDGTGRHAFKSAKGVIDEKIFSLITELQEVAPALGDILLAYFRRTKMHVGYKQLEMLSKSPENMLTRLAIAQRLYEITGDPAQKEKYGSLAADYLDQAAALFALFWGNYGSRKAIFQVTKPARYLQEKGFDMVGDPEKHISQGNTTDKLFAEYATGKSGGQNSLVFTFDGRLHSIAIDYAYIYDAGHISFDFGESEKNVQVDIFGRCVPLTEVMPAFNTKGPSAIFRELYYISNQTPQKFDEIREDLRNMNMGNARFPSTIAIKRNRHSGCLARIGGISAENPPLKYDEHAPNTFSALFPRLYPDADAGESEVRNFAYQQIARRAVGALTVNKSSIAKAYIRSVLAEKD